MTPISVIVTLIAIGVVLWIINKIPMPSFLKSGLNILIIVLIILWFLALFGVISIEGYEHLKLK